MTLKKKSQVDNYHFIIFERDTEEESVLTITKLLTEINIKVTLFVSERIVKLIHNELININVEVITISQSLELAIQQVNRFIESTPVDLIIFTRFSANSFSEYALFKTFIKANQVCSLIENYDRWFSNFLPIEFNGWKILKRSKLYGWLFCKLMFKHFSCYFISEINTNSNNPLKQLIKNKTDKPVLDFPFKIMESEYSPKTNFSEPVFLIPGAVAKFRRDYLSILKILNKLEVINKKWKLIILGRPIGNYGKKVIEFAKEINDNCNNAKVVYFEKYIEKELYEKYMFEATHILAPLNPKEYKYGKDSGAIYDILKYNKIGIINDSYFYSSALTERKVIITFKNNLELESLIIQIINNKYSYTKIENEFQTININFNKQNYLKSLKESINNTFNVQI